MTIYEGFHYKRAQKWDELIKNAGARLFHLCYEDEKNLDLLANLHSFACDQSQIHIDHWFRGEV